MLTLNSIKVQKLSKSLTPLRNFAIRRKALQESYSCKSLTKLHKYAQMELYDRLDQLQGEIQKQPVHFGISLLNTSDKLLGKRIKRKSSVLGPGQNQKTQSMDKIKRKTLLKLMEDLDNPSQISLRDMILALEMLDQHGLFRSGSALERSDLEDVVKDIYLELLENRAHHLTTP